MNLGEMVLHLRAAGTRFGNHITGSAELALAKEFPVKKEIAFVIPLADAATPNTDDSGINQTLTERVAVVTVLANDNSKKDLLGFTAYDNLVDTVRSELFSALLGWQPSTAESLMTYANGSVIAFDRAWLWYQYEFEVDTRLQAEYDPGAGALPYLDEIFTQWKLGGDSILPLPADQSLPTTLLTDPVIEELIEFPSDFDLTDYDNAYSTVKSKINNR